MKLSRLSNRRLRKLIADNEENVVFSHNSLLEEQVRRREHRRDWCLILFGFLGAIAAALSALVDLWTVLCR